MPYANIAGHITKFLDDHLEKMTGIDSSCVKSDSTFFLQESFQFQNLVKLKITKFKISTGMDQTQYAATIGKPWSECDQKTWARVALTSYYMRAYDTDVVSMWRDDLKVPYTLEINF